MKDEKQINKVLQFPQKLPGSFWGITTFFNPIGYRNKYENYRIFRESSRKQGLKLLAVEAAFREKPFELKKGYDADILIQIRAGKNNIMWQKERMLNIALQNLPKDCDKITWLDCDIIFKNNNWINETSKLLSQYKVVQPFEWVVRLPKGKIDADFNKVSVGTKEDEKDKGIAFNFLNTDAGFFGQPGYAWTARKNIFDEIGFFDKNIIGGGDYVMIHGFFAVQKRFDFYNNKMASMVDEYVKKISGNISKSVYYTSGKILHLWHGQVANRKYFTRFFFFKKANFDPYEDIKIGENGLHYWTGNNTRFQKTVKAYLYTRREDSGFLNWTSSLIFKIYLCFAYKDILLLFSDRQVDLYRKLLSNLDRTYKQQRLKLYSIINLLSFKKHIKMLREVILKTIVYLFLFSLNIIFLVLTVFYSLDLIYFLVILCFSILVILIVEAYLRIQHNIDSKFNITK